MWSVDTRTKVYRSWAAFRRAQEFSKTVAGDIIVVQERSPEILAPKFGPVDF